MELHIKSKIFQIRNQYIMLDKDLADLYQVPTKRINEAYPDLGRLFFAETLS